MNRIEKKYENHISDQQKQYESRILSLESEITRLHSLLEKTLTK
jgi:hypothetical protein